MSIAKPFPTQRYYRIAISILYFIQGIVFASWASRIPDVQHKLDLSEGALGAVLFALPVGQLTAMALSGYLVNRFGSKTTVTIGAFLYPTGLLLLGSVSEMWQLLAALFLFGAFGNLSNISVNTQAVGVERLYRRSIMASFHGLWSLAGFVGGIIASIMVSANISMMAHFIVVYALSMILLIVARRNVLPRDARPESAPSEKKKMVKPDSFIITLGLIAFACMICEGTAFILKK
jgi:MFS family permease